MLNKESKEDLNLIKCPLNDQTTLNLNINSKNSYPIRVKSMQVILLLLPDVSVHSLAGNETLNNIFV